MAELERKYSECERLAQSNVFISDDELKNMTVAFIRSQDGISLYRERGKGRWISAFEAYKKFPPSIFQAILDRGSAILVSTPDEPAKTFKARRKALGLTISSLAKAINCTEDEIKKAESPSSLNPIRLIGRLSKKLGLDDAIISFQSEARGDNALACRLKESSSNKNSVLTPHDVTVFSEAAWISERQRELQGWLGMSFEALKAFDEKDDYYGNAFEKTYTHGYRLAQLTRQKLDLSDAPIKSMRELCERIGITYLCAPMSNTIAGATIESGNSRCIITNTAGENRNEFVRRVTIAHELAHILWDSPKKLNKVTVDKYDKTHSHRNLTDRDPVEQRARAFAIEFLLPKSAIERNHDDVHSYIRNIMKKYGTSLTSTYLHLFNSNLIDIEYKELKRVDPQATEDWRAEETYTGDFFPIQSTPYIRRGIFSGYVAKAYKEKIISLDTASDYLECEHEEFKENYTSLLEIFGLD